MVKVTINCDMGEAFGIYRFGDDEACMPFITHANIACGFHASDPIVMRETVRAAKRHRIAIGAHPGLPDREGFGRREMKLSRDEVSALVLYQTGALQAFAAAEGVALAHIKPHGALFGMAQREEAIAEGIADAALATDLPVIAYSDCAMSEVFTRRGIAFSCEFYADLDYDDHGRQIIAKQHRAVSAAEVAAKVMRAVDEGLTRSVNGRDVAVVAQSICVHSDTPNAVEVAKAVHQTLAGQALRSERASPVGNVLPPTSQEGNIAPMPLPLKINGEDRSSLSDPMTPLVDVLRDEFFLTGAKVVCREGFCGACTVLLDGRPVASCLVPLGLAAHGEVATVESLARDGVLSPLQQAMEDADAVQCGMCFPGMLMTLTSFLARTRKVRRAKTSRRRWSAMSAAAPAMSASSTRLWPRRASADVGGR